MNNGRIVLGHPTHNWSVFCSEDRKRPVIQLSQLNNWWLFLLQTTFFYSDIIHHNNTFTSRMTIWTPPIKMMAANWKWKFYYWWLFYDPVHEWNAFKQRTFLWKKQLLRIILASHSSFLVIFKYPNIQLDNLANKHNKA